MNGTLTVESGRLDSCKTLHLSWRSCFLFLTCSSSPTSSPALTFNDNSAAWCMWGPVFTIYSSEGGILLLVLLTQTITSTGCHKLQGSSHRTKCLWIFQHYFRAGPSSATAPVCTVHQLSSPSPVISACTGSDERASVNAPGGQGGYTVTYLCVTTNRPIAFYHLSSCFSVMLITVSSSFHTMILSPSPGCGPGNIQQYPAWHWAQNHMVNTYHWMNSPRRKVQKSRVCTWADTCAYPVEHVNFRSFPVSH